MGLYNMYNDFFTHKITQVPVIQTFFFANSPEFNSGQAQDDYGGNHEASLGYWSLSLSSFYIKIQFKLVTQNLAWVQKCFYL